MISANFSNQKIDYDAILVGAGIMSSTLAILLTEIYPDIKILIIEKLESCGKESTDALNNAGTGHAANCELNYTPMGKDGNIEINKAISINNAFEKSLELWANLHETGKIKYENFLKFTPHISFVEGEEDIDFLKKRYQLLSKFNEFKDMEFSSDYSEISSWIPLITKNRNRNSKIAATRVKRGTDINFGALTDEYLQFLIANTNLKISYLTEVTNLNKIDDNNWEVYLSEKGEKKSLITKYVFLGAGGKAINLLQKSKIPESKLYGGFPVSGKWLICEKPELTSIHNAKVYGKASIGAPPMSVPHLDSRWINNEKFLLFGPFAGFTTKFLKKGSYFDLFNSLKTNNILPAFDVGFKNVDLIKYLISQSMQNHSSRIKNLKTLMPSANSRDWYLKDAGQRVQIIKKTPNGGILKFGTEVVNSSDGSLSALLGASPGASTAVNIMTKLLMNSIFVKNEKEFLETKIANLISPASKDQEIIKSRNNSILGFHQFS